MFFRVGDRVTVRRDAWERKARESRDPDDAAVVRRLAAQVDGKLGRVVSGGTGAIEIQWEIDAGSANVRFDIADLESVSGIAPPPLKSFDGDDAEYRERRRWAARAAKALPEPIPPVPVKMTEYNPQLTWARLVPVRVNPASLFHAYQLENNVAFEYAMFVCGHECMAFCGSLDECGDVIEVTPRGTDPRVLGAGERCDICYAATVTAWEGPPF